MRVIAHVRERQIEVQCGDGTQPVKWLADVAASRYDASYGLELGEYN